MPAAFTVDRGIGQWHGAKLYGGAVGHVQMKPGDGSTLYASVDGVGVFRSKDAGGHWSFIGGDFGIQEVILDPLHPTWLYADGLYRSKDEGNTWSLVVNPPQPNGVTFYHYYPSPYDPKVLFMAISGWDSTALGLRKSTDSGSSWDVVNDMKGYSVGLMAFHPTDAAQMVLVTTGGRVFLSTDGGGHWSQVAKPPVGAAAGPNFITYNPYRPAEVWICWFESVQVTKRHGRPDLGLAGRVVGKHDELARDSPGADDVYMTNAHSIDGGKNWGPSYGQEILFDPVDPKICYRGDVMHGVMKSTDGGVNWTPSNQGLAAMSCNSMAVSPSNPQRVFATFCRLAGDLFASDDGTSNWTYLPVPGCLGRGVSARARRPVRFPSVSTRRSATGCS